ncbi:MAG: thymidine phosphorylase [Actinomycetota bacterium]|nr:thymidine phosphorylase [Actinomycetota bacterium]
MIAYEVIAKKRDGESLTKSEIALMIESFLCGSLADYQMAAFLMACYIRGLSDEETFYLTEAMVSSGKRVDLSSVSGFKVDKHSTGGVGDKTTLVVCPLVASLGTIVSKFSGRGLGHTGGTIDKLESVPGFSTKLSIEDLIEQLKRIGIAIASASEEINPADKRLYALRDVTATVSSTPLIASSIMSKKIAAGSERLVLDVKVGPGAFLTDIDEAKKLSRLMLDIAKRAKMRAVAVISRMDEPLGKAAGNSLEVIEATETLKGRGPSDLVELSKVLAARMLSLGGLLTISQAEEAANLALASGAALNKFVELLAAQGGDERAAHDYGLLPRAKEIRGVSLKESGYVTSIDAKAIGLTLVEIGAGRKRAESEIDHSVGVILGKKVGDRVDIGEEIAEVHASNPADAEMARAHIAKAYRVGKKKPLAKGIIIDILE